MKRISGLTPHITALVGLLVLSISVSAQQATVHLADATDTLLTASTTKLDGKLPVLFVHGHNPRSDEVENPNYKKNWKLQLEALPLPGRHTLPSFQDALNQNSSLGIEPYYIQFVNQDHSIAADAAEIGDAIELILHRHDRDYAYPRDPSQTTNVQVVIIAYSKGTISTRLYLKNLQAQGRSFNPISEFIAIAPPNHGISSTFFGSTPTTCAAQQLMNGFDDDCNEFSPVASCSPFPDDAVGFFRVLNGHPVDDTMRLDGDKVFPSEAPGSRPNLKPDGVLNPPTSGTLYVTLFASGNVDFVGGDALSTDCKGRRLAKNLSPDAIDVPVEVSGESHTPFIASNSATAYHQNTVHTPLVICKALYTAVHHRSPQGEECGLTAADISTIPTVPPPSRAAAMLTLDFSGSMSTPAPPDPSRAVALQDAVALFTHLWMAVGVPSDRLGVTYFRSTVDQYHPPNSVETLPLLSTAGEEIVTNVFSQTPRGLTAMGGGLQQSLDTVGNPLLEAQIRRVILFTDGMQNVSPLVQPDGSDLVIAGTPRTVLNTLGIPIDTIGVGAGDSFLQLLRDISGRTSGRHLSTSDPGADLRQFFVEALINALKGFSPQLVAYRRASVASGGNSVQDFIIEDGPRKVVFEVSWKRGDSLNFTVAKDGVDVTSAGQFINGTTHKVFVINLPSKGINARGNWQLRINGRADTEYEAAAIIDGERIRYDATFNVRQPKTGEPLDLILRLTADGRPIRRSVKVKVVWKSPRMTVGDIIAKYKPKESPAAEPGASAIERQLLAIFFDPKARAELRPATQTEQLKATDKGEYRKQFRPKIPGVHTALVTIEGEDAKLGKFTRTLTATTVVGFANAKLRDGDSSVSEITNGGLRYLSITLWPRDKEGHRLGPGLSSNISLVSAGRNMGRVQDLGDGRYLIRVELPGGEDPMISLNIGGRVVFSGKLSKLPKK